MSYTIELVDKHGAPVQVDRHTEGSNYVIGINVAGHLTSVCGTTDAAIDITYNYARFFRDTINADVGIRWLYGIRAEHCIPVLHGAVRELGTTQDDNYWAKTPGNAGHVLSVLLKWAKQHPDAVFEGD